MSWLKNILNILASLFSVLDKKTLSYDEQVDKIKRDKKEQVKNDWKDTRQRMQDDKD